MSSSPNDHKINLMKDSRIELMKSSLTKLRIMPEFNYLNLVNNFVQNKKTYRASLRSPFNNRIFESKSNQSFSPTLSPTNTRLNGFISPTKKKSFLNGEILQKSFILRTKKEILLLMKGTEDNQFFKDLIQQNGKDIHEKCVKYMNYSLFTKGDVVFTIDSVGTSFFVLLKGSVKILIKDPNDSNGIELIEVKNLNPGDSFGELSLLEGNKRSASVICNEDCHFAVLEKKYFDSFLKNLARKKLFVHLEFFHSVPILNSWPYLEIRSLYYLSSIKEFKLNEICYSQNSKPDYFYIIRNGEFKVTQEIEILKKKNLIEGLNNNIIQKTYKKIKKIEVSILTEREIFGEKELIENLSERANTVSCNSFSASVYIIKKKDFLQKIYSDPNLKNYFSNQMSIFYEKRTNRIKNYSNFFEINNNESISNLKTNEKNKIKLFSISSNLKLNDIKQNFNSNTSLTPMEKLFYKNFRSKDVMLFPPKVKKFLAQNDTFRSQHHEKEKTASPAKNISKNFIKTFIEKRRKLKTSHSCVSNTFNLINLTNSTNFFEKKETFKKKTQTQLIFQQKYRRKIKADKKFISLHISNQNSVKTEIIEPNFVLPLKYYANILTSKRPLTTQFN